MQSLSSDSLNYKKPIVLDLFSGAGGLSLGFEMAGYYIGLGVDNDLLACQTHMHNFGGRCVPIDIKNITDPKAFVQEHGLDRVDVVIGGPPCQGFSRVGRGKIRHLKNDPTYIHDPRNQYYKEFIRFIETLKPLYFVMENVPDMQYYLDDKGLLLSKALRELKSLGYKVNWKILQADHYGVPQTRKRLFIIGSRVKKRRLNWPQKTHYDTPITVWEAISDLPIIAHKCRLDEMPYEPRCELNEYQCLMRQDCDGVVYNHQTREHNQQDLHAFAWMPEGGKFVDLPERFKRYRDDIFKDKYRKLHRDQPSWTLEAHIGRDTYRHIYPASLGDVEPPRTYN